MLPEKPIVMINHHFDAKSEWVYVPVEKRLPVMLKAELGLGTVFEITADADEADELGLLKSALKSKVFLLLDTIKTINVSLGVEVPKFPHGSGARGSVIKVDHARALVKFLFPRESEKIQEELVSNLSPPARPKKNKVPQNPSEDEQVLGMISQLDPENAQAFERMGKLAKQKLAEMYREEGAEKLKRQVKAALDKEDLDVEISFDDAKGVGIKNKRKKDDDADDPQKTFLNWKRDRECPHFSTERDMTQGP